MVQLADLVRSFGIIIRSLDDLRTVAMEGGHFLTQDTDVMGDPADRQMNQENSQGNTCNNGDHIYPEYIVPGSGYGIVGQQLEIIPFQGL